MLGHLYWCYHMRHPANPCDCGYAESRVSRNPRDMTDAELAREIEQAATAAEWDRLTEEYDLDEETD